MNKLSLNKNITAVEYKQTSLNMNIKFVEYE